MFVLLGFSKIGRGYKENYLYPLSSIPENRISESKPMMTRRDAVEKAYDTFELLYGVNLRSTEKEMYINLYKEDQKEQSYQWVMSWYDYETKENFTLTLDAIKGHVKYLYAGIYKTNIAEREPQSMAYSDVLSLVNEFTDSIGITASTLKLEVSDPMKEDEMEYWQQKCRLIDPATDTLVGIIMLDSTNQIVREYELK